jgi:hypothetical protein
MGTLAEVCEEAEAALVVAADDGVLDSTVDSAALVSLAGTAVVLPTSEAELALVATASLVTAASLVLDGTALDGVQHERYETGTLRIVPEYNGHPGTSVRGGARPPPQSLGSQTSPLRGSNQWTIPSSQVVKLWVSQAARTRFAPARREKTEVTTDWRILILIRQYYSECLLLMNE